MGIALRLGYRLLRPWLFSLDAEAAHDRVLGWLADSDGLAARISRSARHDAPVEVAGLLFPNRVGLAAGMDKEAQSVAAFAAMGFGFIEVGSVAPEGESWSHPPRIHRLPAAGALINRIGLHRGGLRPFCAALDKLPRPLDSRSPVPVRLGINLACNAATRAEDALGDYAKGCRATVGSADYFTINLSNPNSPNCHVPTDRHALSQWLVAMDEIRAGLRNHAGREPPMFLKLSPDLEQESLEVVAKTVGAHTAARCDIDRRWGLIVANASSRRDLVGNIPSASQAGGLSGAPLRDRVDRMITSLRGMVGTSLPIIGVGGIMSAADARARIHAGADLVQIYTGLIYRGPDLVREIAAGLISQAGAT
jgi:dihydroorotate dehydrogenase